MFNLIGCHFVSDLLKFPIKGDEWSEHYFAKETENKYVLRVILQPGGDLAVHRLNISNNAKRPWKVFLQDFKEVFIQFKENTIIDVNFSKQRGKVTSFIIKTHNGQICYLGGNLYFRNIKDRKKLQKAAELLDHLFPI